MKRTALAALSFLSFLLACDSSDPRLKPGREPQTAHTAPGTHFDLIPPERTGITFVPTIAEEFRYNFLADPYIYNGGGVAVLDVNNDGLQDLFFTARLQPCHLYLNKGGLHFEDISEKSGVSKFIGLKTGVTVVDINADGWSDLYVCRTWLEPIEERRNLLFVNNKDNTFTEAAAQYGLDDRSASQHANFFDFDLDGDLDCYILNHPVDFKNMNTLDAVAGNARQQAPRNAYESDRLLRNDRGKFVDITTPSGCSNRAFGLSTLASDFNDDGRPDLFVGNDFVMPDFLYLNLKKAGQSSASFSDQAEQYFRHSSNHTMGSDFADLNRDGCGDLVTVDMLAESWGRRQRLMSTMQLPRDRQMQQLGYGRQVMRNALQMSDGPQHFSEMACLSNTYATDWSWAPLIADFDNDGWRDLFVSSGVQRDLNDLDFFLYTADSINRTGGVSKSRFSKFEDYAGLMPTVPSHNYLFQNNGSLQLADVSEASGLATPGFSNGAAYADLDNDGDLDLIVNNLGAAPGLYENKAIGFNAHHWLQIKCKGSALNPIGQGAKVRVWAGGEMIFAQEVTNVRGFYSSVEPIFQVGLGKNERIEKIEVDWQEGLYQILTDLPGNQRLVLDISQAKPGRCPREQAPETPFLEEKNAAQTLDFVHQENPFEDFDREKLLPYRLSRTGPALTVGDLNGDQADDLFAGGAAGQAGAVFLQKADGTFLKTEQPALEADKGYEDTAAVFLDADGDGDLDLYVVSGGNEQPAGSPLYQDRLYANDGKGIFTRAASSLPTETQSGSCVQVFDFDGDGRVEIFVGGRSIPGRFPEAAESFILKAVSGGAYTNITASVCPDFQKAGMVTDIQLGDLDSDGRAEMVVAGDWMPIRVFALDGQRFQDKTAAFGLSNSTGWWNCLAVADLDGDGDLDVAAGNEGLNHRFHASPIAPMRLFANDFDGNHSLDPLLCIADGDAYRVVVQRDVLAAQVPAVKKKFPRYGPYAKAAVTDVFTSKELLSGICLETQTFETQWFENKNGQFIPQRLPLPAQTAPTQHILVADFTGDGHTDLLTVGNEYGSDIETYLQDASNGCLLAGDGRGHFTAIPNRNAGLWANRDARSAAVLKLKNGSRVLVVGNNNDRAQLFRVKNEK